jgi:3-phenylpropionate/trans-cinnamate dioxygenase ferredoxin reductase subunit
MSGRYILIGGGVATASAAAALRDQGVDGDILVVSDEPDPPYERPPLSKDYLTGEITPGSFDVHPQGWYGEQNIELRLGTRATAIDTTGQRVALSTGEHCRYDTLILATGARARRLPELIAGDRVHYLRTIADADRLRAQLIDAKHLVILGAGFIGCEVAAAAITLGVGVTVFDPEPTPLRRAVGDRIGAALMNLHRARGVDIRAGDTLDTIVPTGDGLAVTSHNGHHISCDVLVVGIGCEPNVDLAVAAGIDVDNGIVVDEYFATDAAHVYAIGDVANQYHPRYGRHIRVEHHDTAQRQARQLAANLTGSPAPFTEPPWFWSDQYAHTVQALGCPRDLEDLVMRGQPDEADCSAFSLNDGRVEAVISLDRPRDVIDTRRLITADQQVDADQLRDESVRLKRLITGASKVVTDA